MQGCQAAIEPGVTHQGRKAIHALQQLLTTRETGGVFRLSPQPHLLQGCCQGLGRQFGCATPAGCRGYIGHRRRTLKARHEGAIDALLQAPKQAGWPQPPAPPSRPGSILMAADQLQRFTLRMPGAQGLPLAGRFQIGGQGTPCSHRPHPRCWPGFCTDHGTVATGEQGWMAFHPQAAIGADPAIGIQWQTSRREPSGALASGAEQAGSVVIAVVVGQGNAGLLQHLLDG